MGSKLCLLTNDSYCRKEAPSSLRHISALGTIGVHLY